MNTELEYHKDPFVILKITGIFGLLIFNDFLMSF